MSNFLAIATVTAALSTFLQGEVGQDVPSATVTTVMPDGTTGGTSDPHVNIYAYQVTPNGALRNADVATRRADGSLIQRPQVALDIHYLLSFYGNEAELIPQRMLGSVVRTLHARPVITRKMIQDAIDNSKFSFLKGSNLIDQVERVRLTPIGLNLEELSKLWSVFFQVRYVISVAYQASVVLIESEETPRTALPVRDRTLYILPFRQPVIEQVQSTIPHHQPPEFAPNQPIVYASTLKISGNQLQGRGGEMAAITEMESQTLPGPATLVRIGEREVVPPKVSDTEIELPLSSFPADILRSGIQGIQVVQPMLMGTPPVRHRGLESNVAAIVLRPTMTVGQSAVINRKDSNNVTYCTGTLTLENFIPPVGRQQRVVLLLNEFQLTATTTARGYQFPAPPCNGIQDDPPPAPPKESTDQITFAFKNVAAGTYLVRVQVDGAESLLTVGTDPAQPNNPQYVQPRVTIL